MAMKSIPSKTLRLVLSPFAFAAVIAAMPFADDVSGTDDESARIARLESLGWLWGAVKFFHPRGESVDIDWDKALLETIPMVDRAEGPDGFRLAHEHGERFLGGDRSGRHGHVDPDHRRRTQRRASANGRVSGRTRTAVVSLKRAASPPG
jgi:hypothetical protein